MNKNKGKSYRKAKNKNKETIVFAKVITVFFILDTIVTFLNTTCDFLKKLLELLLLF